MFCSTVNGRMGIVMNVVMTKAGILRHVGQLTSKNYAIGVKASCDVRIIWRENVLPRALTGSECDGFFRGKNAAKEPNGLMIVTFASSVVTSG
ncbi:hypothetical protein EXT53_14880 [Pectobacterium polaris]|uniref:Uncharacterized protein n=1 Tax=Pectobacterium polaris TaxID=2042057 RepID=A0AAW5GGA2_9GAMM|nr:hypothetical protein [Pectobacterium polaris]MCL6369845.1 hypothetical protein [Pectobacterium polaris]